jgi:hypothetical protein
MGLLMASLLAPFICFVLEREKIVTTLTFTLAMCQLSKTIQVILLITHFCTMKVTGPFIIATPLATLPNLLCCA